jgi:hypothetical protein
MYLNWDVKHVWMEGVLTYSMEQRSSWEANRSSFSQDIPRILWNPKVRYRIHKSLPFVHVLSKSIASMLPHPTSGRTSRMRVLVFQVVSFPHVSPPKPLSSIRAICPPYLILLDLIDLRIFGEDVLQFTNYDNTDLPILFTFGITSLDAFRCLLCAPSSGELNCFYFRCFPCPFPKLCMSLFFGVV